MSCFHSQIGQLSTDTLAFHHDVAEFHFDDYQRLLHISGCTLRYIVHLHIAAVAVLASFQDHHSRL